MPPHEAGYGCSTRRSEYSCQSKSSSKLTYDIRIQDCVDRLFVFQIYARLEVSADPFQLAATCGFLASRQGIGDQLRRELTEGLLLLGLQVLQFLQNRLIDIQRGSCHRVASFASDANTVRIRCVPRLTGSSREWFSLFL